MSARQIAARKGLSDQLLVDHDRRHAELMQRMEAVSGDVPDADTDALTSLEKLIASISANTMVGMQAKARTLRRLLDQENEVADDDILRLARSVARDLTRET